MGDVQWKCEADLDSRLKFLFTNVNCEGWSSSDDHLKLAGSCGLEYGLDFVSGSGGRFSQQKQRYGGRDRYANEHDERYDDRYDDHHGTDNSDSEYQYDDRSHSQQRSYTEGTDWGGGIIAFGVLAAVVAVALWHTRSAQATPNRPSSSAGRTTSSSSGSAPPPYNPGAGPPPTAPQWKEGSDYDQASSSTPSSSHVDPTQNVGGFWTGAGLGALGGWLFGRRNTGYGYGGGYNTGYNTGYGGGYNTGFGGGAFGMGGGRRRWGGMGGSNYTGGGYYGDNRGTTTYSFAPQHGSPRNSGCVIVTCCHALSCWRGTVRRVVNAKERGLISYQRWRVLVFLIHFHPPWSHPSCSVASPPLSTRCRFRYHNYAIDSTRYM